MKLADILSRESVPQNNIDEAWIKIKENLLVLGSKNNNKWFNTKWHEAVRERNLFRSNMLQNATYTYQNARSQACKILRQNKRLAENKIIENIEIYKRNPIILFLEKCKFIKQGYKQEKQ